MSIKSSIGSKIGLLLFMLSLAFTGIVVAQVPPPPPPRPTIVADEIREKIRKREEAPKATVRGRVVYADTGTPVRYTDIGFVGADSKTRNVYQTVKTDENGEYIFKGLRAGTYYPDVRNAGIVRPISFPGKRFQTKTKNGVPAPTKELYFPKLVVQGDGVFNYNISARRAAAISGTVSYFDGEPASDLTVQIAQEVNGVFVPVPGYGQKNPWRTRTDDLGYYRLSGLLPGNYKIFVTEPVRHGNQARGNFQFTNRLGRSPFQTYFSAEENKKDGDALEVFAGQFIEDINITLPEKRLYDLSGIIVDKSTGEPLKGFRVDFRPVADEEESDGTNDLNRYLMSGLIGRSYRGGGNQESADWELRNLLPGKYVLTATQVKDRKPRENDEEEITYPSITQEVEVVDSNIQGIRIEVPIGGSLKFQLFSDTGKKVNGRVMLWLKNMETEVDIPKRVSVLDKDGVQYVDAGKLPSGKYEMSVVARGLFTKSIEGSGVTGRVIEIEDGDDINDVKVYMSGQLGTVQGKVNGLDKGAEAAIFPIIAGEDFFYTLMKSESRARETRVGKDGKYAMRLAPGEYSLVVVTRSEIEANPQGLYQLVNERTKTSRTITVGANETINLDLSKQ